MLRLLSEALVDCPNEGMDGWMEQESREKVCVSLTAMMEYRSEPSHPTKCAKMDRLISLSLTSFSFFSPSPSPSICLYLLLLLSRSPSLSFPLLPYFLLSPLSLLSSLSLEPVNRSQWLHETISHRAGRKHILWLFWSPVWFIYWLLYCWHDTYAGLTRQIE